MARRKREAAVSLQPLRVPINWKVVWNSFDEMDPPADPDSNEWLSLTEDLLLLANTRERVLVDVGWMPFGPRGRFVLSVIDWVGSSQMADEWNRPLAQYRSRSREHIVARLESWLQKDWGPAKCRRRQDGRAMPLNVTYVRSQKLFEAEG